MIISKLLPVLCAFSVGALCFTVCAEDNPAQAAARNALANQLFVQGTNNAPAVTNAPPENSKEAKAKARAEAKAKAKAEAEAKAREKAEAKQAAAAKAQAEKEAAAQAAADAKAKTQAEKEAAAQAAAETKAKQEEEKRLASQQAEQAKAKARAEKAAADAQAQQQAAQAAPARTEQTPVVVAQPVPEPAPVTGDNAAQAAAREALAKQLFETTPPAANNWATAPATEPTPAVQVKKEKKGKKKPEQPAPVQVVATPSPVPAPAPVAQPPPVVVSKPGDNNYVGKDLGFKPITAPALPITTSKAERLQALLEQYKADKITPEEYHQQRAAILAEP